jgi:hypothetical protein
VYGYVLTVHRIVAILENKFSIYTGLLWIKCSVEATTLKPQLRDTFIANIVAIKPVGMIASVAGVMRCFIKFAGPPSLYAQSTVSFTVLETRYKNGVYETVGIEG